MPDQTKSEEITGKIVADLQSISTIKQVLDYPIEKLAENIKEYPIACVVESGNESDYGSASENVRVYSYEIWLMLKRDNSTLKEEWPKLRTLRDDVLAKFDQDFTLSGSVMDVKPAPSVMQSVDMGAKMVLLTAMITLKCKLSIDF